MNVRHSPSRNHIETIAAEEAHRARIEPVEVLGASKRLIPSAARKRAWLRLVGEGFSIQSVAIAWGCDRKCIQRAMQQAREVAA